MADIRHAQCHCGAVKFTVELSDGLNTARRCSCSFCRMRGAVVVSAPLTGIKVTQGADTLTEYRFNTGTRAISSVRSAVFTRSTNDVPIPMNMV